MTSCSIVWFRKDLRVHDHQPLVRAAKSAGPVVAVYIFDPKEYEQTEYGFPKTDKHRAQFIRESVEDLRANLEALGVTLLVRHGDPAAVFHHLSQKLSIEEVYVHEEIGSEEREVEGRVRKQLPDASFTVDHGHNLYYPSDLPFDIHDLPDTFSQFRKRIEKAGTMVRPALAPPTRITGLVLPDDLEEGDIPSLSELGLGELEREPRYKGGSSQAKERLIDYMFTKDRLKVYKETRNGMLKEDDSSKFSPWLANGCLSPKVVYEQIRTYEDKHVKNESTYMLYFELLWRDYFHLVHRKYGDRLFYPSGLRDVTVPWNENEAHMEAWMKGETGYPLVDAAMRELSATGFMSNRARQNVASFFTKNLGLDWRIGAAWFESQLVDYDVASNYGNWLYIAGVGNDAVQFRAFNVEKQAKDYDPDGSYLRYWLPELRELPTPWIFSPREMGMVEQEQYEVVLGEDYPLPVVDLYESMQRRKAEFLGAVKG
ncbi:DASH family cryptochrome [Halobacillus fulvus]|nr:DASH family cryptochrome [Halobacillus fulvus]